VKTLKAESADVARYYDVNTKSFLARGQGGTHGAIHRAVWGEGVASRADAFHYVHGLLQGEMKLLGAKKVLDLGCGTGASLRAVIEGSDAAAFGVTNSAVHARLARERLKDRATISEGDFCSQALPRGIDLAYGIESFVHAPDPKRFFANVTRSLRPEGRLALCDDFLVGSDDLRWVREYRDGWHASSLLEPERVDAIAATCGLELVDDRDFTSLLELDRPRDRILGVVVAAGRPVFSTNQRWLSLSGGNALRQCLKQGYVRYRYRVWKKLGSA
jgi:SAM-dependent methyltransferase